MKDYDEKMSELITHAIYFRMTIRDHVENFISLLITKLSQHDIILEKSWMRKHKVSYHDHSNNISFLSNYCSYLDASERSFSTLSNQIKEMLQDSRKEKNDFKLTRILKRNDIEFSLFMRQRNQETNLIEIVISLKKKKRKIKKNKMIKSIMIESIDSKIYMIEAALFYLLIK
jgi:hypothetical protein